MELNAGFTLIEMMMVIVIVGVLAAVALVVLDGHSVLNDSKKVRAMQQLKNLSRSLALYNFDFNQYPNHLDKLYSNSKAKIYLKKDYIDNELKQGKNINYHPQNSNKSYKVDVKLNSGIQLLLTPQSLKETK